MRKRSPRRGSRAARPRWSSLLRKPLRWRAEGHKPVPCLSTTVDILAVVKIGVASTPWIAHRATRMACSHVHFAVVSWKGDLLRTVPGIGPSVSVPRSLISPSSTAATIRSWRCWRALRRSARTVVLNPMLRHGTRWGQYAARGASRGCRPRLSLSLPARHSQGDCKVSTENPRGPFPPAVGGYISAWGRKQAKRRCTQRPRNIGTASALRLHTPRPALTPPCRHSSPNKRSATRMAR